jgi:uncharacterized protein (DUF697 family)
MASAIVPIIAAAAPLLTPLIHSLVLRVEGLFGSKTGPVKLDAVVAALSPIVTQLATSGKIPGQLSPADIAALVESIVQMLKSSGLLNPDTAAALAAQPIGVSTLPPGTMLRIVGGTLQLQFG